MHLKQNLLHCKNKKVMRMLVVYIQQENNHKDKHVSKQLTSAANEAV